ncbi:MAG: HEAT repeat domain-containing protein, partial [Planctomycetes bacterium]|nr:HEAT repeat domain-containing protein [Planctomycetota bacterium]
YKIEFGFSVIVTGSLMDQDVRNSVLSCLVDQSSQVREAASIALGNSLDFKEVRESFSFALDNETNPDVKNYQAKFLSLWASKQEISSEERYEISNRLLRHVKSPENGGLRFFVKSGFQSMKIGDDELRKIIQMVKNTDINIQLWAVSVITSHFDSEAFKKVKAEVKSLLIDMASNDANHKVREYATRSIGLLKEDELVQFLIDFPLRDPQWNVRVAACDALSNHNTAGLLAELDKVSKEDSNEYVRAAALNALNSITKLSEK